MIEEAGCGTELKKGPCRSVWTAWKGGMGWFGDCSVGSLMQWVYEVQVPSYAGHPVLLAGESISHVQVFQDRRMLMLHDGCQFKMAFTLNSNGEYPCFASSQPPKYLVSA